MTEVHQPGALRPAFAAKPDPEEPWRYVCPDCEKQVRYNSDRAGTYRCDTCDDTYPREDLLDQKTGETGVGR